MEPAGIILFIMWAGLIYLCLNPEAGARLGAWLRKRDE